MVSSEQILELYNRLNDLFIYLSIEKKEKEVHGVRNYYPIK